MAQRFETLDCYLHHVGPGLHWSEPLEAACFIRGGARQTRVEGVTCELARLALQTVERMRAVPTIMQRHAAQTANALYCQEQCAAAAFSRSRPGADGWQETPGSRFRVISKKHLLAQSSRGAISSEPLVLVHSFNFHRRRPLLQTQICARMVALFLTPSKRTTCELFHQHCQSLARKSSQDNVMISLDKNGVHRMTLVRFVKFS